MTVNEMIKLLDSLNELDKEKRIVFCHNPSKNVCDYYVPEYGSSYSIYARDVTIYMEKPDDERRLMIAGDKEKLLLNPKVNMAINMTVNEMIKWLESLPKIPKGFPIVFCHNLSRRVCDEYVPESDTSCCITKKDITIYIKKVDQ